MFGILGLKLLIYLIILINKGYYDIYQIDKNGNTIKIWENLSDILKFFKIKNRKYKSL